VSFPFPLLKKFNPAAGKQFDYLARHCELLRQMASGRRREHFIESSNHAANILFTWDGNGNLTADFQATHLGEKLSPLAAEVFETFRRFPLSGFCLAGILPVMALGHRVVIALDRPGGARDDFVIAGGKGAPPGPAPAGTHWSGYRR
jgi:hypothetical protein